MTPSPSTVRTWEISWTRGHWRLQGSDLVDAGESVPVAELNAIVKWCEEKARMAWEEAAHQTDMARVHRCEGQAHAWQATAAFLSSTQEKSE